MLITHSSIRLQFCYSLDDFGVCCLSCDGWTASLDSNLAEKSVPHLPPPNLDSAGALCWSSQHWLRLNWTEVYSNIINLILFVRTARKFDAFCVSTSVPVAKRQSKCTAWTQSVCLQLRIFLEMVRVWRVIL